VAPGIFVGGRWDSMTFSKITSPNTHKTEEWDANVNRYEIGAGWRTERNLEFRYVYQGWRYPEYKKLNTQLYALQCRVNF